jgi:DNA-binding response OmpR family regulator
MPKMTGYQVLQELEKRKDVKRPIVIMLTAKAQHYDKEKGLEIGADYFLTKPFSPLELLDLVENIFRGI